MLRRMLSEVVVTPYDTEKSDRLSELCDSLADEVTLDTIDRYIKTFVLGKPDKELKKTIEAKYAEKYPEEEISLPPLFTIVFSQYIVKKAIENNDEELDAAVMSLKVMNHMLYRKGSLTRLILPNHIKEMYFKMDEYIAEADDIEPIEAYAHDKDLMENSEYLDGHYNEEGVKKEIRCMAKEAYLYRRGKVIERCRAITTEFPFVKVYISLYEAMKIQGWLFLNNDVNGIIKGIVSEDLLKKAYTVEKIVGELKKEHVEMIDRAPDQSSLLLRYVKGEEIPRELKQKRLSVQEFGIYVYYELLLENIISEYYG